MFSLLFHWIGALIRLFRNRRNLELENLVLRQQLAVLRRRHPRLGLDLFDKLFLVVAQVGRKQTPKEVRELIFRMVAVNPTWGAPRIPEELLMLGFDLSERTIPVG
jgi:hypothetical protein